MKSIYLIAIAIFAIALTGCSETSNSSTETENITTAPLSKAYEEKQADKERRKAAGIPVTTEDFEKMVEFVQKNGFTINGGPQNIPCGKQYTFYDTNGNRHGILAIKSDSAGNASMTGTVKHMFVYGYKKGIRNQENFFPYVITSEKVYNEILSYDEELEGIWPDADMVRFGYKEFLAMVKKS